MTESQQKQETAEDSEAGLSVLRLNFLHLTLKSDKVNVNMKFKRTYYCLPTHPVSSLYLYPLLRFCLQKNFNVDRQTDGHCQFIDRNC